MNKRLQCSSRWWHNLKTQGKMERWHRTLKQWLDKHEGHRSSHITSAKKPDPDRSNIFPATECAVTSLIPEVKSPSANSRLMHIYVER
jgi:hypothetical protein